jgi:hypothetical protein
MEAQIQSFIILLFNDFLLHYKFTLFSGFWPVNIIKMKLSVKKPDIRANISDLISV